MFEPLDFPFWEGSGSSMVGVEGETDNGRNGEWARIEGCRCCMQGVWRDIDTIWAREGELVV